MDTVLKGEKGSKVFGGIVFCIILLLLWLAGAKIVLPSITSLSFSASFFISRILFWLCLAALWTCAIKIEKLPLLLWDEKTHKPLFYIISIVLIMVVVIAGSSIISIVTRKIGLGEQSSQLKQMLGLSVPIKLFTVFTAAIAEELFFRGYLLSRLQLYFKGSWLPVIISSLIFGLAHVSYGTILNMAGPLFIGLVFAWHYQKYRNIKILMVCHFLIDFFALVLAH